MTPHERDEAAPVTPETTSQVASYQARIVQLEQRLDDLTRLVSDLVWDIDANLRVTYISERVFDILGFIPHELIGKRILELGAFEDEAAVSAPDVFRRAFRNRRFVINDKQGRTHNFRISGIPLFDLDSGQYLGARGTADDDTMRRAAEQALRDGERRYRQLVERSPLAMLVLDGAGILFANESAVTMFGATSDNQLIGHDSIEFIHPDDHAAAKNRRAGALGDGQTRTTGGVELLRVRVDGSTFYSTNSATIIDWEGRVALLVSIMDITEFKNAEVALAESEQRFRDFAQSAADRFWETDENHRIVFTSAPRGRNMVTAEQSMTGRLRWEPPAIDPEDEKWVQLRRDMETHVPIRNFRYQLRDPARKLRYLVMNGVPVFDASGEFRGYRGTTVDETAETLARQEAEGIQHLLRLTTDAVPAFIGYHDRDLRFRYANSFYRQVTGMDPEKIIGRTIAEVFGEQAEKNFEPHARRALSGEVVKHDNEIKALDGRIICTESVLVPDMDANGEIAGFFVMSLDVTERKRAEDERERSRAAMEAAQRLAHIGSFEHTYEPDALYWTPEMYHICGVDPDGPPITYSRFIHHIHPADRSRVQRALEKAIRNRTRGYSLEYRVVRPDGTERNLAASGEFTYAEDGRPLKLVGSAQDITVQKRIQAALERAKLEAETASRAKSEFLSSMSHELRTPMNAVLGYAQLLLQNKKEPVTPRQRRQINQILKSGQHLLSLINDILDLSRIEAGRLELDLKELALDTVIGECLGLVDSLAERYRVTVVNVAKDKPSPTVRSDDVRLKQALLNLLSNSIKFNKAGGRVTIDVAERRDGMVRISVDDTGNGIAPARHSELFEPFSRLDATQRGIEGTGIGLAISKQLVERMGGSIGFSSELGVGSTFWIDVPHAKRDAAMPDEAIIDISETAPAFRLADGTPRTLLYVEDDASNLQLVEEVVSHIPNLKLLSTPDAESGLELAAETRPDIILMDINLPGMNGYEALAKLKRQSETATIPVVALSAAAMPKDIQRGVEAGFFSYLTKPFVIDELLSTIDRALADRAKPPVGELAK
jgi:PAS domain S-box-containing protein